MSQAFDQIIGNFGKTIGIPELELKDGYCCVMFDDIVVNIEERGSNAFFYTTIGELPQTGREELYATLLGANYLYRETQGCVIGADEKAEVIVLAYQTPVMSLDDVRFEKIVENFINVAESWSAKVGAFAASAPAAPSGVSFGSGTGMGAGIRA